MVLLVVLRAHLVPRGTPRRAAPYTPPGRLPRGFFAFSVAVALSTGGLMTFGVMGFHLVEAGLVTAAAVPVVYAGAMAVAAVAALVAGIAYDRLTNRSLLLLPALVAPVPALALAGSLGPVLAGIALWGAATGIQDSTVKALVAELVPHAGRATAYGVFAAVQGVAALLGGVVAGALYADHLRLLAVGVALAQVAAYVPLVRALRATHPSGPVGLVRSGE
jgi:MFS family permease